MYFINLSNEEISKNFQEIARFEAFYSESANGWLQRVLGTCYEFFVIDQRDLKEDPSSTALSDKENVAGHWFQDVTDCKTKHLFRALGEGRISEETYRAYADEDVRIDCAEGERLNRYAMLCPKCGRAFDIYTPADRRFSVAGTVPNCPFCGEFTVSVDSIPSFQEMPEHGEITIDEVMCGAQPLYAQFRLYPQVEGEDEADRQKRIVSYVLVESENDKVLSQMSAADRASIVDRLYEKNPRVMQVALDVLKIFAAAVEEQARAEVFEVLDSVTEQDDGPAVMRRFGAVTHVPAGLPVISSEDDPSSQPA